jgi:hypothetical protein
VDADGAAVPRRHALVQMFQPELVVRESTAAPPVDDDAVAPFRSQGGAVGPTPRSRRA